MNGSEREGVFAVSKRVIVAAIAGWLFVILAVVITTLIYHSYTLPVDSASRIVGTFVYPAALLAGFFSGKSAGKKGLVHGLWAGVIFVLGYFVLHLITKDALPIFKSLVLLILSAVGGIFGINMKTKRRR